MITEKIYEPFEILDVLNIVRPNFRFSYDKKIRYFNVPVSFDIETSSFFRTSGKQVEKVAICYEWSFCIYGLCIVGRTWDEFIKMISTLSAALALNKDKRLLIYVQNLGFEFQFMRHYFQWDKVFSLDVREPVYAITTLGVEFRCSYVLSGYSLEKIGEHLKKYKVEKKVGDLDYNKLRHSATPLTDKELGYCINDVKVVAAYIAEEIEELGGIARIPLTKTGFVRRFCRDYCFNDKNKKSYKRKKYGEFIHGLKLEPDEYTQLKRAFQGGFAHANPFYTGKTQYDVTSFDFTSSYPSVMLSEQFPMSKSEKIVIHDAAELEKNLLLYCCLFDIEIVGLQSKILYDNYISLSRCWSVVKPLISNGRIVSADKLCTTVTEQDFFIIRKMYSWDNLKIGNFRRYRKAYLPTDFVKAILKLYENKTTLKDVEGFEAEYLNSKEMVNSAYGMTVTDIIRAIIEYGDDWLKPVAPDLCEAIKKYNSSRGRFLFYPWGVWVTAYARRNLFTGIFEFQTDYICSDTDSMKVLHPEKHSEYIKLYNERISTKLKIAMKYHGIDDTATHPKTKDGEEKPLGVWDFDGHYSRFRTLGAKRYIVEYSSDVRNAPKKRGKINITVSGLNKSICVPFLLNKYGDKVFDNFTDGLYIPPEYTGKLTHTYIDEPKSGRVIDYLGQENEYNELSSVHLEKADYTLSIAQEYSDYILSLER